jgi:hypothetical protein
VAARLGAAKRAAQRLVVYFCAVAPCGIAFAEQALFVYVEGWVGSIGAQTMKRLRIFILITVCAVGAFGLAVVAMAAGASP